MKMHVTNRNCQYAISNLSRYTEGHHIIIRTNKGQMNLSQGSSVKKLSQTMFLDVEI